MFGFGLGYAVSRAAEAVVKVCGGSEDSAKAARFVACNVMAPIDPIGSGISVAQWVLDNASEDHPGAKHASNAITATMAIGGLAGGATHVDIDKVVV